MTVAVIMVAPIGQILYSGFLLNALEFNYD